MKFESSVVILITAFLTSGCGDGIPNGSSSRDYTGYYVDAPVYGLNYEATPSGISGVTDPSGTFRFRSGDIVKFEIPTTGGNISAGEYKPPSKDGQIVPVLTFPNGVEIAQVLQSIGTNDGVRISVKDMALPFSEVAAINNFLTRSGMASKPAVVTVSAEMAQSAALAYLERYTSKGAQIDFDDLKGTWYSIGEDVESALVEYKNDNTMRTQRGFVGTLKIRRGSSPEFVVEGVRSEGSYSDDVSLHRLIYIDKSFLFHNSVAFDDIDTFLKADLNQVKWRKGTARKVLAGSDGLSKASLAGKTFVLHLSGFTERNAGITNPETISNLKSKSNLYCSDQKLVYTVSPDGSSYERACQQGATKISDFKLTGSIADSISGVVKLTDDLEYFMGMLEQGTKSINYVGLTRYNLVVGIEFY